MAEAHIIYALAWLSFGAGHSLLAAPWGRGWLEQRFGRGHRLAFNLIAVLHILAVILIGRWALGDAPPFALPEGARLAMLAVTAAGAAGLIAVLRSSYDGGRLLGTAQWRGEGDDDTEALRTDGVHAWVRHPLYLAGMLVLWGRALDPFGLATAVWATLYLLIGAWFEERKLLDRFGAAYAEYRARVPMIVPWKGRVQ